MSAFSAAFASALDTIYASVGETAEWTPDPGLAAGAVLRVVVDAVHEGVDLPREIGGRSRVTTYTVCVRAAQVAAPAVGDTVAITSGPLSGTTLRLNQAPHHVDGDGREWRCPAVTVA